VKTWRGVCAGHDGADARTHATQDVIIKVRIRVPLAGIFAGRLGGIYRRALDLRQG
jgi:hypothetical protein